MRLTKNDCARLGEDKAKPLISAIRCNKNIKLKQIAITGSWSGESAGIRVDGQEFPRQMSISAVRNANGELTE